MESLKTILNKIIVPLAIGIILCICIIKISNKEDMQNNFIVLVSIISIWLSRIINKQHL